MQHNIDSLHPRTILFQIYHASLRAGVRFPSNDFIFLKSKGVYLFFYSNQNLLVYSPD